MTDLWSPVDPRAWQLVPALVGRVATESDVARGIAVFYIEGGSKPHPMDLPCRAVQTLEDGSKIEVVAIQAEACPDVIVGVRYVAGGNGICTLKELEFRSGEPSNDSPSVAV